MTACDDIRPRLAAWLDGELADVDTATVDDHVRICVDCAGIVQSYRAIKAAAVVDAVVDEGIWDAVSAAIDEADAVPALLTELQLMRDEMRLLRSEVAELRRELARRPSTPSLRTSPFSLPDVPERPLKQYRLV